MRVAAYLGAWALYGVLWSFIGVYSGTSLDRTVLWGFTRFASGAALGLAVHRLCGVLPWRERGRAWFVAAHLAAALAFGGTIVAMNVVAYALYESKPLSTGFAQTWGYLPFELLMDACLYGFVAAVSYTLRSERRAREERLNVVRAEAAATRAQLAALRAQINPHFLFNALHSLAALVRRSPDGAEEALERLGGLLRYSLDEAGDHVSLKREWEFVRDYVELERLRLGDRLRVEEACDRDAGEALVPPFTLQPLVENAIRHGVAPVPEGGRVRIAARVEGDRLVLVVEDDGPGCTSHVLDASSGHGLRSLRERLAAGYGGSARLTLTTFPGSGFAARVEIPCAAPASEGRSVP